MIPLWHSQANFRRSGVCIHVQNGQRFPSLSSCDSLGEDAVEGDDGASLASLKDTAAFDVHLCLNPVHHAEVDATPAFV